MKCLHCGKPLSILRRLQNQRFCSKEHHQAYVANHHERAFGELLKRTHQERSPQDQSQTNEEADTPELAATSLAAAAEAVGGPAPAPVSENRPEPVLAPVETPGLTAEAGSAESAPEPASPPHDESPDPGTPEHYAHFLAMVEAERHYYQNILDLLPAGVAVFDSRLSLIYSNRKFREEVSLSADEAQGTKLTGLFAQNDVLPAVQQAVDSEEPVTVHGAVGDQGRWDLTLIPIAPHDVEGSRHLLVYVAGAASDAPASAS